MAALSTTDGSVSAFAPAVANEPDAVALDRYGRAFAGPVGYGLDDSASAFAVGTAYDGVYAYGLDARTVAAGGEFQDLAGSMPLRLKAFRVPDTYTARRHTGAVGHAVAVALGDPDAHRDHAHPDPDPCCGEGEVQAGEGQPPRRPLPRFRPLPGDRLAAARGPHGRPRHGEGEGRAPARRALRRGRYTLRIRGAGAVKVRIR